MDEYGGTAGLVTLEDVVAEIVGDLQDELVAGTPSGSVVREPDGSIVADGRAPLDDVDLDAHLPGGQRADTVGEYVLARLGRLASPGDTIDLGGWEAVVEDVRARRVHRVRFRPRRDGDSRPTPAPGY